MLAAAVAGCGSDGAMAVRPGVSVGAVAIGMRFGELERLYGPMPDALVNNRFVAGGYAERALDVILTSPEDSNLSLDAKVIAVGAKRGGRFDGTPRPGQTRAEIEAVLGAAPDSVGDFAYWPDGVSVAFDPDGTARAVGVFAPYSRRPEPPEMAGPTTTRGGQ